MRDERVTGAVDPFDVIGIGFGPSNLSLAVCAREIDAGCTNLFFERNSRIQWHPGMLFDGSRMQISFLKDIVSLRNPSSPYTFLQYLKAQGRLEHFVNLNQFRPTRLEYQDYLRWVASHFSDHVRYDTSVRRVTPVAAVAGSFSFFQIEVANLVTRETSVYFAKNVVYAAGGRPHKRPSGTGEATGVFHSSEFLPRFPTLFADQAKPYVFAVAGAGQSAGEVAGYLLDRYEQAQIHLLIPGHALRPTDNSPFVNEQFYQQSADDFYGFSEEKRTALLHELRNTNYGSIREDLLDHLYNTAYLDSVKGRQRLFVHTCSTLGRVDKDNDSLRAKIEDRFGGPGWELQCDGIVLATGYDRCLDPEIFADVLPLIVKNESGNITLSRNCRVKTSPELIAGIYVQGYGETVFGLGDTLLSLLPFRSKEIFDDIRVRTPERAHPSAIAGKPRTAPRPAGSEYPPKCFLEHDPKKLYAVMERFRFATVISARQQDDPVVTQVPLTLDRSRGDKGVLIGHMDKANPHVDLLDGRRVLVLFHGPNAYISPKLSRANVLPTWNSITVRANGRVTLVSDRATLVQSLCSLAEQCGHNDQLSADDPRIEKLVTFIVGFEIEIEEMIGRFKLSQDRSESDRHSAATAMARKTEAGELGIIEYVLGPLLEIDAVTNPR